MKLKGGRSPVSLQTDCNKGSFDLIRSSLSDLTRSFYPNTFMQSAGGEEEPWKSKQETVRDRRERKFPDETVGGLNSPEADCIKVSLDPIRTLT